MPEKPTYESESKVDMAKLREAVGKVFAYTPPQAQEAERPGHHKRRRAVSSGSRPTEVRSAEEDREDDSNSCS